MSTKLHVPPAARSPFGPDGVPKTSEDVSHRVHHRAKRQKRAQERRDAPHAASVRRLAVTPLVNVAVAAFAGYALGFVLHRR